MKKTLLIALCLAGIFLKAQDESKNIIKFNLTSLLINNYALQYERVLSPKTSIAIQGRFMPETSGIVKESYLDDEDAYSTLKNITISNYAITPEFRWYLGQGYGKGFYIAPFYRYSHFEVSGITETFESDYGVDEDITLSGDLTAHSFGVLFGAQWHLGANIILDWWILGPHYGVSKGEANGTTTRNLSTTEQERIKADLEDLDLVIFDQKVTTRSNGADMSLDGMFAGVRAGISIGYRF
ncbi:MAG: DUF3575 domain-containing protein [Flavobacteriales bacterium]|nr:DUF3575 domain-containing protein [Flavobacteriales bacterium]